MQFTLDFIRQQALRCSSLSLLVGIIDCVDAMLCVQSIFCSVKTKMVPESQSSLCSPSGR